MQEGDGQFTDQRRGRGRPRKYPLPDPNAPKRGRGRPRKAEAEVLPPQDAVIAIRQPFTAPVSVAQPDFAVVPESPALGYPEFDAPTPLDPEVQEPPGGPTIDDDFWGQAAASDFTRPRFLSSRKSKYNLKKAAAIGVGAAVVLAASVFAVRGIGGHSAARTTHITENDLLQKVGRLTELPAGERPMVYTVSDQSKTSQPFLKNALAGDQVLVYKLAGKAIIYRIATDKLIAVGPTTVGAGNPSPVAKAAATTGLSVALYNGSAAAGVTANYELKLESKPGYRVVMREKAARSDYAKTIVIDLSGKYSAEAHSVASLIGADVVAMPDGEIAPTADLLVIVGADFK